jgi:hypothetical protein
VKRGNPTPKYPSQTFPHCTGLLRISIVPEVEFWFQYPPLQNRYPDPTSDSAFTMFPLPESGSSFCEVLNGAAAWDCVPRFARYEPNPLSLLRPGAQSSVTRPMGNRSKRDPDSKLGIAVRRGSVFG